MNTRNRLLVGREAELATIERVLERVDSGRSGCVTFEGEPGIGKTRLLSELHAQSEAHGHITLKGSASEFERDRPFAVAADAFEAYLASLGDDVTGSWPPELRTELGRIFPSLGAGESGAGTSTGDERYRAHRAVRDAIERLGAAKPVTVVLDDLHWADDASLELIQALLRRPPDAPLVLAMGFRTAQAPERLDAALAAPGVERIKLEPLTRDQAAALLAAASGSEDLDAIYEQGGGNPFYLEQLARIGAQGAAAAPSPAEVPTGIAASVAEEVSSLGDDARALLQAGAVAGDPFEPDVAAEIAELSEASGFAALDELLAVDLVQQTELPRRFRFRHPLVREAVYNAVPAGSRIAAHGRTANALAARGASALARAHHIEHAASQGDEQAIALLIEAGDASAARAPVASARWYDAALRLLPERDVERGVTVRGRLAQVLRSSGHLERSRTVLLDAIGLLDAPGDPVRIDLTRRCAAIERWLGREQDAHARLLRARQQLPPGDEAGQVALEIELAIDAVFGRQLDSAIEHGEAALAAATKLGSGPPLGAAAAALCLAEAGASRIEAARDHRAIATEVIDRLVDEELTDHLDSLYHLSWAENYLEQYDAALAHIDRMSAIARESGARPLVPMMLVKCYPLETLGRLREASELSEEAVEATQLDEAGHFLPWALFERAWAHYYLGELPEAIACAEESMRISDRRIGGAGPSAGVGPAWALGLALIESGKGARAAELLSPLAGDEIDGAMPVERGFFWEALTLAELSAGRTERAEEFAERAARDAASMDLAIPRGTALRARSALTLARGNFAEAAEHAAASAEAFGSIGARVEVAFSRSAQGQALAESGDRDAAIDVLREAEAELDACGSIRERNAARRALRKLGARAEVRGPATGAAGGIEALTKREREIAELVTDRKTNREIAAELFLSEKTIESHLRNVFAKLGVDSRVEVARMVERGQP